MDNLLKLKRVSMVIGVNNDIQSFNPQSNPNSTSATLWALAVRW